MHSSKSELLLTKEDENAYSFPYSDANGFPRPLPPVRKIGLGRRALAGLMPSDKGAEASPVRFESSLERDFFVLLEFNTDVIRWNAQPIRLDLGDGRGTYVPDVLATFVGPSRLSADTHQILYEIKYREDLAKNWRSLRPRYRAAMRFARGHGWRFKIMTEREIRTPLLWNAKFLLPYRHDEVSDQDSARLLSQLSQLSADSETTPRDLLKACSDDRLVQAGLLSTLWHLVASRRIATDLRLRLSMQSRIWLHE